MKKAPPEFIARIKTKMGLDNLGISDLARKIGVSHPTITEMLTYGNQPSFNTCVFLSSWLGESPEMTARSAGLLPPKPDESPLDSRIHDVVSTLPTDEDKQDVLAYVELRRRIADERGKNGSKEKRTKSSRS